ncbi:MAG: universal stress protein [Actinomycetota bacterium]|nr:universal stress protein [Actinomycetota bacterium]
MNAPVVVAVDGSKDGRRALHFGIALATAYDAPLRLVHVRHENVLEAPMMPMFPDPLLKEVAVQVLHHALADTQRMGWRGPTPETVLAWPPRVAALVDHTGDSRCVVLGSRSAPVQHLLTGSTTNGVAAHSSVPVVCVPSGWDESAGLHRIAVGVECSEEAQPVIEGAVALGHVLGAQVLVVHAWRPIGQYDAAIGGRAVAERWAAASQPVLENLVEPVRAASPDVKIVVELRYERPVVALHELSRAHDLLVIGRHGRHTRLSPRLGTTARTVIRTSECPVVVVPAAQGD